MSRRDFSLYSEPVETVADARSINDVIVAKVNYQRREGIDEPFYVVDLNDIIKKHEKWKQLLPRVTPFYAVKCLSEPAIIELLVWLGLSFDCASKNEIQQTMDAGVTPDRIIYANTIKSPEMIRFASQRGVDLMTFDNEEELLKIKQVFPKARLVLRILPPKAKKVITELGHKFGCHVGNVRRLLQAAKDLELNVVGISFHVGFGCSDAMAFVRAVEASATAFDTAKEEGFDLELLDIGGGFPGTPVSGITMEQVVDVLGPALDKHFPEERGVRIIAEPGAYFVGSALHLATQVIGRRVSALDASSVNGFRSARMIEYYLNDGNYGSFGRGLETHRWQAPVGLRSGVGGGDGDSGIGDDDYDGGGEPFYSVLYGPTCDGVDEIMRGVAMPERQVGDWVVFPYMGQYTISSSSAFNGMPRPRIYYVQMADFDSKFHK